MMLQTVKLVAMAIGGLLLAGCAGYRGEWPRLGDPPAPGESTAEVAPVAVPEPVERLPRVVPSDLAGLLERSRDDYAALVQARAAARDAYERARSRIVAGAPQQGGRAWWDAQLELTRLGDVAEGFDALHRRLLGMRQALDGPEPVAGGDAAAGEINRLLERVGADLAALHAYLAAERNTLARLR